MILTLIIFGLLTAWFYRSDPFQAGVCFAIALYPVVKRGTDALIDRVGWLRRWTDRSSQK